jgi:hypothetical protein
LYGDFNNNGLGDIAILAINDKSLNSKTIIYFIIAEKQDNNYIIDFFHESKIAECSSIYRLNTNSNEIYIDSYRVKNYVIVIEWMDNHYELTTYP